MRSALLVIIFVCVAAVAAGCGRGNGEPTTPDTETGDTGGSVATTPAPPPPPPPVKVGLRVIHAASLASKSAVAAAVGEGDESQPLAGALEYGATSAYAEVTLAPEASKIALAITAEGLEGPPAEQPVSDGGQHTFVIFSDPEMATQLNIAMAIDEGSGPEEGMRARFFHGVAGWDAIDVCTPGETARAPGVPVFTAVGYGGFAAIGYQDIPPETKQLKVRIANEENPCSGKVIGGVQLAPPEGVDPTGKNLSFFVIGRSKGRPAVARELLVCTDAPDPAPACFRLKMKAR